ncbi:MAG: gamma-glutamyl-gamma-aminobutyrate hydrolase family protein [Leptospiraceae bacterium]|nr:gamma-glutamyl-gamma-aminobutyrate hydrolase family protein [Leptospiraceae bacterium]
MVSNQIGNILLIIDPFLREPANDGINVISELLAEIQKEKYFEVYTEVFFPSHSRETLRQYLESVTKRGKRVIGVISLGSYANVTDSLEWVNMFGRDLKECVIEKGIPFLGICFSHQLFGWLYGANVDYVANRENLPEKKYNEFRKVTVLNERLKSILGEANSFISHAKHEQEVKNIPEDIELTCTSEHCEIEGLAHKVYPAFSFQTHPEDFHESREGWNLISRFIGFFIMVSVSPPKSSVGGLKK